MRTTPRSTRRTTAAQLSVGKENQANLCKPRDNGISSKATAATATTSGNKKARHRVSTAELARLEDTFRLNTHPSRQQKKELATELGMDYKTVTIWFQNKRQTSKRSQPPPCPVPAVERLVSSPPLPGRTTTETTAMMTTASATHADAASCLRSVSSPSHNATLGAFQRAVGRVASGAQAQSRVQAPQAPTIAPALDSALASASASAPTPTPASVPPPCSGQAEDEGPEVITSRTIGRIRPLLDSLSTLASKPRERSEMPDEDVEAPPNSSMADVNPRSQLPETAPEIVTGSIERNRAAERGQDKELKSDKWKRMRTLEWACERQAKRRKLTKERFVRSGSDEPSDDSDSSNDARMDSALSLLSLAATTAQMRPSTDVMRGVLLLLNFKHSWHRK